VYFLGGDRKEKNNHQWQTTRAPHKEEEDSIMLPTTWQNGKLGN
jgi:hypothetical protein